MKAVRSKIGDTDVLIESMIDDDIIIFGEEKPGRKTEPTGAAENIKEA